MRWTRTCWPGLLMGAALLTGCCEQPADGPASPEEGQEAPAAPGEQPQGDAPRQEAVTLSSPLSQQEAREAEGLVETLARGAFPWTERARPENARRFVHLAATSSQPEVIAAALQAMAQSWSAGPQDKARPAVDQDYRAVVLARLRHSDPAVVGRAIEASVNLLSHSPPDSEALEIILEFATGEIPAARFEALMALSRVREFQREPRIVEAYYQGMSDPEAFVASTAILHVQFLAYDLPRREEFMARAQRLLGHEDPGVRGRALLFAAGLARGEEREAVGLRAEAMLVDPHPYVRSVAASAVAALDRKVSIPRLIRLLDDQARNTYSIQGFKRLSGESGSVPHSGSAWFKVNDAALAALQALTATMGDDRFIYPKVDSKTVDADIARGVKEARAWFSAHRDALDLKTPE